MLPSDPLAETHVVRTPDGVDLAVADWGGGRERPAVLFVHGFAQSQACWQRQTGGALRRAFRLVTYDSRGHGRSAKPRTAAAYRSPELWAGEVDSVIRALDLQHPVLVVWSYGGRIALDYLAVHGDSGLAGLVMVAATSSDADRFRGPAARHLAGMAADVPDAAEAALKAFMADCSHRPLPRAEAEALLRESAATPVAVRRALGGRPADYDEVLSGLTIPVLAIHGAEDRVILPGMAAHTAGRVRDGEALVYPDVGHMPFREVPERFDHDLARFVRKCRRRVKDR